MSKTQSKAPIAVHQAIAVLVLMGSVAVVGLSFAAAALKLNKDATTASCTPATPYFSLSTKNNIYQTIRFSHMMADSLTTGAVMQRREELANGQWTGWQALPKSNAGRISTVDLSAYPNKHYEYRVMAVNDNCPESRYSVPTDPIYISTYDFIILNDTDDRDPFKQGKISNINGQPWYNNPEMPYFFDEVYREDACYGYGGYNNGIEPLREVYLAQSQYTGPMGHEFREENIKCQYGCYAGRCTEANETCPEGWYCLSPASRAYLSNNCHWSNAENVPNDDMVNYRCISGEFERVTPLPTKPIDQELN